MEDRSGDDRDLVRRCREGSEAAYADMVRRHRPRLYGLAYRLLADRELAEDVVQETFLAAFRAIDRVEPRPSLSPWLNTIVLRIAGRAAERTRGRPKASLDQMAQASADGPWTNNFAHLDPTADPHAAAEAAEFRRAVALAMGDLPFAQRAAVTLRYVLDLEYSEAAASMGVPLNTFKSHLLRGTRSLRLALGTAKASASPVASVSNGNGTTDPRLIPERRVAKRTSPERATARMAPERTLPERPAAERATRG